MRLRHPPGRGGRLWLVHRRMVASTGADLLDKKRRALVQEYRRLRVLSRDSEAEWNAAAVEAQTWADRLAIVAGEEELNTLAAVRPPADVTIHWRSQMGVAFASEARVDMGPAPVTAHGGSSAADFAVPAARRALEAGVKHAVTTSAFRRISAELAITTRRQRALERRWLPELARAIARLNEMLDENEREEAVRSVWSRRRMAWRV